MNMGKYVTKEMDMYYLRLLTRSFYKNNITELYHLLIILVPFADNLDND